MDQDDKSGEEYHPKAEIENEIAVKGNRTPKARWEIASTIQSSKKKNAREVM